MSPALFSLTEFAASKIPRQYAILSHRWTGDEVTFSDMGDRNKIMKEGYRKLEFCANQAKQDGITHFWIDSCCIDKSSSAELSEAINSMFKWYKNATICYVYMSDTSVPNPNEVERTKEQWKADFQYDRWFSRGWTLQELVAPACVEFFSKEGTRLGDKRSLEREIHQASGVPIEALRGAPLTQFDDQERMAWAARRETTVEEDAAYCLLGLFDVQMPLLYGEGRQKAMDRLQREIYLFTNDVLSLTVSAPWVVPFERNKRFTGRAEELENLQEQLFVRDQTSKWAIVGLGGVGKTQLVMELVYQVRLKYRDCAILWISAASDESLHQGFVAVARQLKIPGSDDKNADVVEMVGDYLSHMKSGRWLLIFDNADDITMWTTLRAPGNTTTTQRPPQRLIDRLPRNKRGCIVFTSRDQKAATKLAGPNVMKLSAMDDRTAIDMFNHHLINPNLCKQQTTAKQLVIELACLPLALVQAAAYINANGCTLPEYLELLKQTDEEVIGLLGEEFEAEGRCHSVNSPIATTWLISFEQIRKRDALAADYLSFMACIHYKDVPQSLLPPGPSRRKEMEAIGTLAAYSFVERRAADSALDLHRLVHLTTRNWLRKENTLGLWQDKTLARLAGVFPSDDHQNRSLWRMYLPHTLYFLSVDEKDQVDERISLMDSCARCLFSDGRWNEAEGLFSRVIVARKMSADCTEDSVLASTSWLASTYRNQGRWQKAEELEVQVMETRKRKLGEDHPDTLTSMYNLSSTWHETGRENEAIDLMKRSIVDQTRVFGVGHPQFLLSTRILGEWEAASSQGISSSQ